MKNSQISYYHRKMAKKKHWSNGVPREPVTVTYNGREYAGHYQVGHGVVRVTYDFQVKSTRMGPSPLVTARHLLTDLVKASIQP